MAVPAGVNFRRNLGAELPALLFLAALAVFYFLPWILGGLALNQSDYPVLNGPLFHWMHGQYSRGLEPLWAQGLGCGNPFADAQVTPRYYPPLRFLLGVADGAMAYALHLALHLAWLAWGCYLLARHEGASREGSLIAAVVAGFAGGPVFSFAWFTVLVSLAWFPWMILGLARLQKEGAGQRWGGAALLGLALGLGFSGGYPGMVLFALLPLGLVHAKWFWEAEWLQRRRVWAALFAAALVAALLAAGPLLDLARLSPQSERGAALSLEESQAGSLSPAALAQVVAPHALGREADSSFLGASWRFGSFEPQGLVLYLGLLGLVLALAGWRGPGLRGPLLLGLGLLLLYALGRWTPLHALVTPLPVFDHLRAPMKAGLMIGTLLCLPVAFGYDRLRQEGTVWSRWILAGLGLGLVLMAAVLWLGEAKLLDAGQHYIGRLTQQSAMHQRSAGHYGAKLLRWLQGARSHFLMQGVLALGLAALLGALKGAPRAAFAGLLLLLAVDLGLNGRLGTVLGEQKSLAQASDNLAWLKEQKGDGRMMVWGRHDHLSRFGVGNDLSPEDAKRFLELPTGDQALYHGLEQFNGYTVSSLKRHKLLFEWARDDRPGTDMLALTKELLRRRRVLDLGAVRYIISTRPLPGMRLARQGDVNIYENPAALPFAYFATQVATVKDGEEALKALIDSKWQRPAFLESTAPAGTANGNIRFVERSEEAWDLNVEAKGGAGTLVLSRAYYEGLFKASVDGIEVPLMAANAAFCAIAVPEGKHRVRVDLDQKNLKLTSGLFLAGCLAALALFSLSVIKS